MKRGYLAPPAIIILGLICFFVGATLLFNSRLITKMTNQQTQPSILPTPRPKYQSKEATKSAICAQVITPATNPKTGERKEFPTPCDVPEGWQSVK